ncbi:MULTISPECIES: RnfABCDGE type electron transport complex subunit D [Paenibacillus]|uniref:RnfABCDGE type electron transport complex subunit D n=1 Tax=Paenibacillus violae TaxID=3077234 RepID=A0ABU3RIF3_9BACL|nr:MULTISPECIES: RnfABCDGE type electron transport complex subunit D [Paenibacillus]MDU0204060.1 RnfABCDGE type electron transport complex subunit D [Paenibacillus sp. PFR10]MEC0267675.1 RnfABCDGE type electron transport complex subunit D [Paenibacillus anseongense]
MSTHPWHKKPKSYVIICLVAFLVIAEVLLSDIKGIYNVIIALVTAVGMDGICFLFGKRKKWLADGAVITGFIIGLILSTTTSWYLVAITVIMAILSKHLIVFKKKPVFNPAAFGLLLSILFFQTGQSWWGAFGDLPVWTIGFLLVGGYVVTNRVNKFPQVFAFLSAYFLLLLLMGFMHVGEAADAFRPPFINASMFFALFMLTDPPTSPVSNKDQVIFGVLSAIVGVVIYGFFGGLMYLFIGLLISNAYQVVRSRKK